jgi:hypothetical protein
MNDTQRNLRIEELREHREELDKLTRAIAELRACEPAAAAQGGGGDRADVVFLITKVIQHRVSAALLAAQLATE